MLRVEYARHGPPEVLSLVERPTPEPGRGEVRVAVAAAAVNPKDILLRKGKFRWLERGGFPKTCGADLAGRVEALGPGVTELAIGEEVYGHVDGMGGRSYAEQVVVAAGSLAPKPQSLTMAEAASISLAGQTALQALRDLGHLGPGQRVCIHGASGGVGTLAVQIAKALGASVVAVCSARNEELVRGLGADEHVDYKESSPTAGEARYDVFFDVFGNQSLGKARRCLKRPGVYISTVPKLQVFWDVLRSAFSARRAKLVNVRSRRADLERLAAWVEAGKLRPVVDRELPLAEVVEAHRYIQTKRARGKVVLRVGG